MEKRKLLLVGWDAADWKVITPLVQEGLMPNVARLVERGVTGNIATLQPVFSPMLWTSIATGKRPYKHGIHGFSEPDPENGRVRPVTNLSRKTKAVWNILHQQGLRSNVIGWWPSSPAEPIRGCMVSNHFQQAVAPLGKPWPMRPGTIHPPELAAELAELRLHPHELEGDLLRNWVPRAPEIDQEKDRRLEAVAKIVAECTGIHAAATHLMTTRPDWDFMGVYYDAIDHFGHGFMRYHPPRVDWVTEEDFELYRNVVRGGYIYHDMMLGALLKLAGPETTVILMSDHGFHPDHLRVQSMPNEPAGPAAEHRKFGIFAAAGPGIRQGGEVHGASLLDIAPTILNLFGLPAGRDMDGRVLTEIYETPQPPVFIDSWDAVPGDDGRHPPETRLDPVDSQQALRQLVDLGYIDEPDADATKAVEETVRELRYNLAMSLVDGGQYAEASAIFAGLWDLWPEESRFGVKLLDARMACGQVEEARETMILLRSRKQATLISAGEKLQEQIARLKAEHPLKNGIAEDGKAAADGIDWEKVSEGDKQKLRRLRGHAALNPQAFAFLEGSLLHLEGRHTEALATLAQATGAQTSNLPSLHLKMAEVCVSLRDWKQAADSYTKVLALDPLNAPARLGMARAAFHARDWSTAAEEARASTGLVFHNAPAHYLAALALWKLGKVQEGRAALDRAIAINPVYPAAHRSLAAHHLKKGEWDLAQRHLQLAREARSRLRQLRAQGLPPSLHPQEYRESFGDTNAPEPLAEALPTPAPALPPLPESIVIVTGLPRSGTSMMMQMLQAGGLPVMADAHRPADASNERGYLEHELARKLARDASWMADVKGQAVKIVAQLLPHLPLEQRYRIIMMHRPLPEIIASQQKMLNRLGRSGAALSDEALAEAYRRQITQIRTLLNSLRQRGVLDVLDIHYHHALQDPAACAGKIAAFLGETFNAETAAAAVAPLLRHETLPMPLTEPAFAT